MDQSDTMLPTTGGVSSTIVSSWHPWPLRDHNMPSHHELGPLLRRGCVQIADASTKHEDCDGHGDQHTRQAVRGVIMD